MQVEGANRDRVLRRVVVRGSDQVSEWESHTSGCQEGQV